MADAQQHQRQLQQQTAVATTTPSNTQSCRCSSMDECLSTVFCCCCGDPGINMPDGVPMKGECHTLPLSDYELLLEEACPLPPRDLYFYDESGQLRHHFDFCIMDPSNGCFWTKCKGKAYQVLLTEKQKQKHRNRWDQIHCLDQYLREFSISDSSQVFITLNRALRTEIHWDNWFHRLFHSFMIGGDDHLTREEKFALKLRPEWFPDRLAFFNMLLRVILNTFYIVAGFYEVRRLARSNNNNSTTNHGWWFVYLAWFIQSVEGYLFITRLIQVLDSFKSLLKRRIFTNDTIHFQAKNLALDLVSLSSVSVLRYLPSTETVSMAFKRKNEWKNEWIARIEFQMYAIPRQCPSLILIRELIELFLICVMPLISPFALLTKLSSLKWMVNDSIGEWTLYRWIIYLGFVNQMSGLRKIKEIESNAIEHLIFSGHDAKLQLEEHLMINSWWNYVLVSALSSVAHKLDYYVLDQMVWWYKLTPRKLQLLIKQHQIEGRDIVELNKEGRLYQLQSKHGYVRRSEYSRSTVVNRSKNVVNHSKNNLSTDADAGVTGSHASTAHHTSDEVMKKHLVVDGTINQSELVKIRSMSDGSANDDNDHHHAGDVPNHADRSMRVKSAENYAGAVIGYDQDEQQREDIAQRDSIMLETQVSHFDKTD